MPLFPSPASCPRPKSIRRRQTDRISPSTTSVCETQVHSAHVTRGWVLCIDDDEEFLLGLKLRLESQGYHVVQASEGTEGCRIAKEMKPSAIILDLCLPGQDGEQVLSALKESELTAEIPVLVVTGKNEPRLDERIESAGASRLLNKPVDHRELTDFLGSLD